jgi:trimethylamine--corrinoid protein Co-methyltransferase
MPPAAPIKRWKQTLADYQAPPMDEATDEALVGVYVERTKAAQADAWY